MSANRKMSIRGKGLMSNKNINKKFLENIDIVPTSKRAAAKALKKKKKRK